MRKGGEKLGADIHVHIEQRISTNNDPSMNTLKLIYPHTLMIFWNKSLLLLQPRLQKKFEWIIDEDHGLI
jgi:hypothetical protein